VAKVRRPRNRAVADTVAVAGARVIERQQGSLMIHPPLRQSIPTLILVAAIVILAEAIFVMASGWNFHESILGGRIKIGTAILFVAQLAISGALLSKYSFFPKARRIALTICTVSFAILACCISVEFTWAR
jgi:hypothetical protein